MLSNESQAFNSVITHPLQLWEWGEFKKSSDVFVERVAYFEKGEIQQGLQVFFHKIPYTSFLMGYYPKGYMPDEEQLSALRELAKKYNAIAIKMEPNIAQPVGSPSGHKSIAEFLIQNDCVIGRSLFTKYTFMVDLTLSEERLMENMKSKTRYNVQLAEKKGVQIVENTSDDGMKTYLDILDETTKRQGFYAHTPEYFENMWKELGHTGLMRIFEARYDNQVLVSWILFISGDTLYYPYGSSRAVHRDVMASNLMMWEVIKFGKSLGLKKFDMWGALGPDPDKNHAWYGFHRFKEGYGGELYEFLGTYDLVFNKPVYKIYTILDEFRWKILRLKARLRRFF